MITEVNKSKAQASRVANILQGSHLSGDMMEATLGMYIAFGMNLPSSETSVTISQENMQHVRKLTSAICEVVMCDAGKVSHKALLMYAYRFNAAYRPMNMLVTATTVECMSKASTMNLARLIESDS